jgi:hypothetical protein
VAVTVETAAVGMPVPDARFCTEFLVKYCAPNEVAEVISGLMLRLAVML